MKKFVQCSYCGLFDHERHCDECGARVMNGMCSWEKCHKSFFGDDMEGNRRTPKIPDYKVREYRATGFEDFGALPDVLDLPELPDTLPP